MQKMYTPARIGVIFVLLAAMLTVFVSALYVIQIHDPILLDESQAPRRLITRRTTIPSARGNIYDRNGVLLASGTPSYNIKIDWHALRASADPNGTVLALVYAAIDEGIPYLDTFPVTRGAPFEFSAVMTASQRSRLDTYLEFHNLDPDIEVSDLLAWMRNHYNIDYTVGILDARLIIGVRYELEIRAIIHTITPYIFAEDVTTDFVSYLEERSLVGVFSQATFIREYHTTSAPHIIGYTGPMTAEEFAIFGPLGYPMDAIIGKIGVERAFEEHLHGRAGEVITRTTNDGTVVSIETIREPEPGDHIILTIDIGLQIAAENALQTQIEAINLEREEERLLYGYDEDEDDDFITGGSVVVIDINTGEVLAIASYPTFNLITLAEDWSELINDPTTPMLNRATQGRYTPGSTFKMVTALAGMRHVDQYGRYAPIRCTGHFDRYRGDDGEGFGVTCGIFRTHSIGHGSIDLREALAVSCNFYFIQVAHWLSGDEGARVGAYRIAEAAMELGLGIPTGLEIPENPGVLATPTATGRSTWHTADTLLAGFGQGENRFTPVQLANYAATLANGGTLHSLTIVRTIRDSNFGLVHQHEPVVLNVIEEANYIRGIQDGMVAASRAPGGTARTVFGPDAMSMVVASKTGTAQIEGHAAPDGAFVAYAPAQNPQIAIAVVVERGGSGSAIMPIAKSIIDHFFATESAFFAVPYGEMIP